ncbi:16749_t:CDS:1, partial [Acaulospora morrowiae]
TKKGLFTMCLQQIVDTLDADIHKEFVEWLLKIGEGRIPEITHDSGYISLPSDIVLKNNTLQELINFVYPELPT